MMSSRRRKQRITDTPAPTHAPPPVAPTVVVDAATLTQWLQASIQNQQQQTATHQMYSAVLQTLLEERRAPPGPVVGTLRDFNSFNPPMFSGEEEPEEADAWLKLMQRLLMASHIPEEDKVSLVQTKMKGEAGEWIESEMDLRDQVMTWDTFKKIFKERFFPPSSEREMIRKFMRLTQGDGNVASYSREFQKLSRYVKGVVPNEAARMERYIEGLRTGLRALVRACQPTTVLEAYQHALQMEQDMEEDNNKQPRSKKPEASPIVKDGMHAISKSVKSASRARLAASANKSNVTCHGCRKRGHIVKECWLVSGRCIACGSYEHKIGECPEARSKSDQVLSDEGPEERLMLTLAHTQTPASDRVLHTQSTVHRRRRRTQGRGRRRRHVKSAGAESA